MNKFQKIAIKSDARRFAGEAAQEIAQNYAILFIQDFLAHLNEARGRKYQLRPAKYEDVLTTVRGLIFEASFEKHFEEKLDELTKEAKREAAAERRDRKHAAECDAWRRKRDDELIESRLPDDEPAERVHADDLADILVDGDAS